MVGADRSMCRSEGGWGAKGRLSIRHARPVEPSSYISLVDSQSALAFLFPVKTILEKRAPRRQVGGQEDYEATGAIIHASL